MKSKREQEEDKKKADEQAAAKAYEDFYNTFVDVPDTKGKVWVKAGTLDAGSRKEDTKDSGKLYKPSSKLEVLKDKFSSAEKAAEYASPRFGDRPEKPGKKKEREKKKSNLELFKEELKMIQEERAERHRIKSTYHRAVSSPAKNTRFEAPEPKPSFLPPTDNTAEDPKPPGSWDGGDPSTTNLYLGNLSPKITEQGLMELFGRYGPLASIKIMWPRTDDERSRGRNCGFVAFMNRKDGERALANLNGKDIDGFEMKLGWGKCVPIPPHPIYIPPSLMELTLPPPPSGLAFNAQPMKTDLKKVPPIEKRNSLENEEKEEFEEILQRAVVKVVIPTERNLLHLIHRTIEFVIREGPMFEAMVMNKELSNPDFRFLFDNQSPAHVYYRWKLFSVLQGESLSRWCTKPFRLFKGGSIWKPPPLNPFLQGMPEELVKKEEEREERSTKGSLSIGQRNRLESLIRGMTPEKLKIGEAMVWCIDHAEAAEEICMCIAESLTNSDTLLPKKISRLYLVSDILHNCSVKVSNASFFRKFFQEQLMEITEGLHKTYTTIESRLRAEQMKQRVMSCFRIWEDWTVYPHDFLIRLQNIFLGIVKMPDEEIEAKSPKPSATDDVDGIPIDDVDGFPLQPKDNGTLLKQSAAISALLGYNDDDEDDEEDIDGAPLEDDIDGMPLGGSPKNSHGFVPSKWESVSPKRVESQAMTLSKWDEMEANKSPRNGSQSDTTPVYEQPDTLPKGEPTPTKKLEVHEDLDGIPMMYDDYRRRPSSEEDDTRSQGPGSEYDDGRVSDRLDGDSEERRSKLRAVEVKVLHYQDELEKGIRPLKSGYTIPRQVQHYRHKLLKKIDREEHNNLSGSERRMRRHKSRSSSVEEKRSKKRSRSPRKPHRISRSPRRHRSRSPRKRRSYSRSPSRKHKKKRH